MYASRDTIAPLSRVDAGVLDEVAVFQAAANGANVAVTFTRFTEDEQVISTFDALYLVTNENGGWGVRARSSFAP